MAALRALLRDPVLMAGVVDEIATTWSFTPDQLDTLAVLLRPARQHRPPPRRRTKPANP